MHFFKRILFSILGFLITLPILSLLFGSIYIHIGGIWNKWFVCFLTIVCLASGIKLSNYLLNNFKGKHDLVALIILFIAASFLFGVNYAPILEISQDPSIYLFKALNLINYGTVWQPFDTFYELQKKGVVFIADYIPAIYESNRLVLDVPTDYGAILNHTKLSNNQLRLDFFYGATFLYAYLGEININLLFGAPFIVNVVSMTFLYVLFKNRLSPVLSLIATLLFFVSPAILWYGRTPFSEPIGLMIFLLLLTLLKTKEITPSFYFLLTILSISFYLSRIDMIIVLFITTFFITTKNLFYGVLTLVLFILIFILSQDSTIYFERLSNTLPLKYFYPVLFGAYLLGFIENKVLILKKIIYTDFFFYLSTFGVVFITLFAFRDNVSFSYEEAIMHGRLIRTFNETNMEKIIMILPDFMVFAGLLFLPYIISKKILTYNQLLFLIPLFIFCTYYIYKIYHSPQLYWSVRRYLYVLLPTIYISGVFFISIQRKLVQRLFITILALSVVNQTMNASIFPEMKDLDKNVKEFIHLLPNEPNLLIVYNHRLKNAFSSVIAFSNYDVVPIVNIAQLEQIRTSYKNKKIVYIDNELMTNSNIKKRKFELTYPHVGINYFNLPTDREEKLFTFYIHFIDKNLPSFITDEMSKQEKIERIITMLYKRYLKRIPNDEEQQPWIDLLCNKIQTIETIEKAFIFSKEYQNRFILNKNIKKILPILYQDIKGEYISKNQLNRFSKEKDISSIVNLIFQDSDR